MNYIALKKGEIINNGDEVYGLCGDGKRRWVKSRLIGLPVSFDAMIEKYRRPQKRRKVAKQATNSVSREMPEIAEVEKCVIDALGDDLSPRESHIIELCHEFISRHFGQ